MEQENTRICSSKNCEQAGKPQPVSNFYAERRKKDGLYSQCKLCCSRRRKERYHRNPVKERELAKNFRITNRLTLRWQYIKRTHGLSKEQWNTLFVQQNGKCLCCGDQFPDNGESEEFQYRPVVHHCHLTGEILGLLCNSCNTAEGFMKTPERAFKLYEMMEEEHSRELVWIAWEAACKK